MELPVLEVPVLGLQALVNLKQPPRTEIDLQGNSKRQKVGRLIYLKIFEMIIVI